MLATKWDTQLGYLSFCVIQKTALSRLFKRDLSQILAASTPLGEQFSGLYSKASAWNNKITRATIKQNNTSDIITINKYSKYTSFTKFGQCLHLFKAIFYVYVM